MLRAKRNKHQLRLSDADDVIGLESRVGQHHLTVDVDKRLAARALKEVLLIERIINPKDVKTYLARMEAE